MVYHSVCLLCKRTLSLSSVGLKERKAGRLNSRLSGLREKRLASTKGDLKECRDRHAGFVAHSYAYVGSGARTSAENKFRIRKIYWQFITF